MFQIGQKVQNEFGTRGDVLAVSRDGRKIKVQAWGGRNGDKLMTMWWPSKGWCLR